MLIKEVCGLCGLTRKAVEYYERQGLVRPGQLPNGYRDYSPRDIATLKEIAALRGCGLSTEEVRTVLDSGDKTAALTRMLHLHGLRAQRQQLQQEVLAGLAQDYRIQPALEQLRNIGESGLTVRERLLLAFPGSYGVYLSLHFGRFLNQPVETDRQRAAYAKILEYLDAAALAIPGPLADYMEEALPAQQDRLEALEQEMQHTVQQLAENPEAAIEALGQQGFDIDAYIAYRRSEEFAQSPAGRMAALLREFQQQTGYTEVFLANLRILSPEYESYCNRLEAANQKLLEHCPETAALYGVDAPQG